MLERLKTLREKAKVNQQDLADSIHTSRGTYSMYENGHRQPPYEILVSLAEYYHVSVDYLLGLTDNPEVPPKITEEEYLLLKEFRRLDKRGKQVAFAVMEAEFRQMLPKKSSLAKKEK
ncbi:helix-turn-helix domain-containing protein [Hominifimenecus sp. rT4P-3]|uniref:helix-turn-helix domain-containing protein n=1 Tax=Hominifimenecus sp. rT4P-3 TaxID=3242979 RepID=UPI003DA1E383